MPEKTIRKNDGQADDERQTEKNSPGNGETDGQGNWSQDQQEKSYYYDDAYGYEIYDPAHDDDDEIETRSK